MTQLLAWPGWDAVQIVAAVIGLVASVWFVSQVFRETGMDWRRNPFGRFLVQRKALLAVFFIFILFSRWQGGHWHTPENWAGRDFILAVLLMVFAVQTFRPYRLLMAAQRAHDNPTVQEAPR